MNKPLKPEDDPKVMLAIRALQSYADMKGYTPEQLVAAVKRHWEKMNYKKTEKSNTTCKFGYFIDFEKPFQERPCDDCGEPQCEENRYYPCNNCRSEFGCEECEMNAMYLRR